MIKKFMRKYGFVIILTLVCGAVFAAGVIVGMHSKATPTAAETKTDVQSVVSEIEATEAEASETTETTGAEQPQYCEMIVNATAYCPCADCCGKSDGITATGTKAIAGRTIAVDPSVIPYGTEIIINGNTYVAEDCGGAVNGNDVDIFFNTHEEALNFGRQQLTAYIKN